MLTICVVFSQTGRSSVVSGALRAASTIAPTAPIDAASVGVAMPPRIEPSTAAISSQRRDQHLGEAATQRKTARRFWVRWQRGRSFWPQDRDRDQKQQIKRDQRKSRHQRAGKQVTDRKRTWGENAFRELCGLVGVSELVAEQHQHGRRRKNLRERRSGGYRSGSKPRVVAETQHRRQHDQAHGHRGSADHSFCRGKQRPDDHRRNAEARHVACRTGDPLSRANPRRCASVPASRP